jgi:hypothetical protein
MSAIEHTTNADYPLIGYEYEYLGHPVKVLRVMPHEKPEDSHVEFSTRFDERSNCEAGELTKWQDTSKLPAERQYEDIESALVDAIENASSDAEKNLARWQLRRLEGL